MYTEKRYPVRGLETIILFTTAGKVTMRESRLSSKYTASTLTSPAAGGDGSTEKCCESQCHTYPIALTHLLSLALWY